jgi:hypothetical protein
MVQMVNGGILELMPKLTPEIVNAAIEGFEQQKLRIDSQIAELRAMLPGGRTVQASTAEAPGRKRRNLSAAARKRIGDAQRKRWAESKGETASSSSPAAAKPKRKLSAAGKAAIVAAQKKRWAAKKAGTEKARPAVTKKAAAKKAVAKKAAKKSATKKAAKAPEQAAPATQ